MDVRMIVVRLALLAPVVGGATWALAVLLRPGSLVPLVVGVVVSMVVVTLLDTRGLLPSSPPTRHPRLPAVLLLLTLAAGCVLSAVLRGPATDAWPVVLLLPSTLLIGRDRRVRVPG